MSGESYEGWANRPTWLANLWAANDYGLYLASLDAARDNLYDPEAVGGAIVALLEAGSVVDENMRTDFCDDGRPVFGDVDLVELGEHWIADVREVDA